MGKVGDKISRKIAMKNKTQGKGYCVICGNYGALSKNHVPPKSVGNIGKTEQLTLTEYFSNSGVKPLKGNAGNTFNTICSTCNGDLLGSLDSAVAETYHNTLAAIGHFVRSPYSRAPMLIKCDVRRFCRSMVGHILSSVPEDVCLSKRNISDYFENLYKFVQYDDHSISKSHDFYLWFYPHKTVEVANMAIKNSIQINKAMLVMSYVKFFPFGFAIAEKGGGLYFEDIEPISIHDNLIRLNFQNDSIQKMDFPFHLKDDEFAMLNEDYTTVAKVINHESQQRR